MQVQRWGDGLAVRLSDQFVRDLDIVEGDELEIEAESGRWRISRGTNRRAALAMLESLAVDPPAGFRFSRDEAHARSGE